MKYLLFLITLLSLNSYALVDMRNSNFTDTWVDLEIQGSPLKVERIYNSRTLFSGMFGFGWCSDLETNLEIYRDVIALNDCSGVIKSYNKFLKNPNVFLVNGIGPDSIEFKNDQYIRSSPVEVQTFDSKGRLIKVVNHGTILKLVYKNRLESVIDQKGNYLNFDYYDSRHVKNITASNGLKSDYNFENINDLDKVRNGWGNTYSYGYDNLHNLTLIQFPDTTTKVITYNKDKDLVTSFKDRNGCVEKYAYDISKDDLNHYVSTVIRKCGDGLETKARFEFWFKFNLLKTDKYLTRVLVTRGSDSEDSFFNELGLKTIVDKNGLVTKYQYDTKCQKMNKITHGKKYTLFKYDAKCDLILAKTSSGDVVKLQYDEEERISSLIDKANHHLSLTYDQFNRPSTVELAGVGKIHATYKSNGEIKKVDSPSGRSVVVMIAKIFELLMEIVGGE